MRLSDWLKENPAISQAGLARDLKVTPGRVSQLLSDETAWPGRDLASRLSEITGGAVTPNDFICAPKAVDA